MTNFIKKAFCFLAVAAVILSPAFAFASMEKDHDSGDRMPPGFRGKYLSQTTSFWWFKKHDGSIATKIVTDSTPTSGKTIYGDVFNPRKAYFIPPNPHAENRRLRNTWIFAIPNWIDRKNTKLLQIQATFHGKGHTEPMYDEHGSDMIEWGKDGHRRLPVPHVARIVAKKDGEKLGLFEPKTRRMFEVLKYHDYGFKGYFKQLFKFQPVNPDFEFLALFVPHGVKLKHVIIDTWSFDKKVIIPEPTTMAILGAGTLLTALAKRRKKK